MTLSNALRVLLIPLLVVVTQASAGQDHIVLTVTDSGGTSVDYDLAALEAMDSTNLLTHTSWTDGLQRFTGVRASLLLAAVEQPGASVRALALNDYEIRMSVKDLTDYPVIIAYKRNGEYMAIRDKGPLWIIFPQDDHPELTGLETDQKMVWQLRQLVVE
ncbi:oxidoreductase [Pseudomonas sp. LPB0260]|uniref:oxidoreductase n=1 Tax=Pseudomonas sp. LPB0260 TaxID=2614442 RepID=UPI0015C26E1C|nr:oxidoreductase [Pseudomonas sp. LPB0260]QLC72946.1 oxidoreductase [Pseudomonas sp. LPB0260]QLC75720.1 oxidoreductase [Pseudomonas sp. LPB0260]